MRIDNASASPSLIAPNENAKPDLRPRALAPMREADAATLHQTVAKASRSMARGDRIPRTPPPPTPTPLPTGGASNPAVAGQTTDTYYGQKIALQPSLLTPDLTAKQQQDTRGLDALYRPSTQSSNDFSRVFDQPDAMISGPDIPGGTGTITEWACAGSAFKLMQLAATGTQSGNLLTAEESVVHDYEAGGQTRENVLSEIRTLQDEAQWGGEGVELPNHFRHPGSYPLTNADVLIAELRREFSMPYLPPGQTMGSPNTFATIVFSYGHKRDAEGDIPAHMISIQRLHERSDPLTDSYALFDAPDGVFRYENFNQLAYAFNNYFRVTYGPETGFTHAATNYYAMSNVVQHESGRLPLGAVGDSYGIDPSHVPPNFYANAARPQNVPMPSLTPPRADLPPPPHFDQPGPSGYLPPHRELKRSANVEEEAQPRALYRPSNITPTELKKRGGFNAERTSLQNVNLDTHNYDVAVGGRIDGAGYLGTFRERETALTNRALASPRIGYIYDVAPSPNMVDVNGSLQSQTHGAEMHEVAAMGRIDYTQIRGWRRVENGKAGAFVANQDYRWDVYDQTRIAGAQPQLARFGSEHQHVNDSADNRLVFKPAKKGATPDLTAQDPNLDAAAFYGHALEKIARLNAKQTQRMDYRGPVMAVSHDGAWGYLTANIFTSPAPGGYTYGFGPKDSQVTVANSRNDARGLFNFRIANDGRFHVDVSGTDAVLRVNSDGYLYLGKPPGDPNDRNGAFRYEQGRLVHEEDGKVLTFSHQGNAYVSSKDYDSPYSIWRLTDVSGKRYLPPKSFYAYRDTNAGSARSLYEFEKDPDSALPQGRTQFVTEAPLKNLPSGDARKFMGKAGAGEQRETAQWLDRNNAALLFKDGFYITSNGADGLEIHNLDGTVVAVSGSDEGAGSNPAPASAYSIPDDIWQDIRTTEARRRKLISAPGLPQMR